MKKKQFFFTILALIGINIYFLAVLILQKPIKGGMKAVFFDVGQGDASLVMAENDVNILIDGGPDKTVIEKLDKYLPLWNRKIDIMVLTHPHADHVSGLIDVLNKYGAGEIWMTGVLHNSPEYLAFLETIKNKSIKTKIIYKCVSDSCEYKISDNTKIEILYPKENLSGRTVDNLNNSSIVLKVSYKNKSFLFSGDIEKEAEDELWLKDNISADILKTPHHGSSSSSGEEFLKSVNPKMAIISLGADNDFGMPSLRVIRRMERMGIKIFRTDLDGDVEIETDGISYFGF